MPFSKALPLISGLLEDEDFRKELRKVRSSPQKHEMPPADMPVR
jgi:mannitol/fructose-specific phosphotransferase system IIA component (Ntr-type)